MVYHLWTLWSRNNNRVKIWKCYGPTKKPTDITHYASEKAKQGFHSLHYNPEGWSIPSVYYKPLVRASHVVRTVAPRLIREGGPSRCRGAKGGRRASSPCPGQEPATNKTRFEKSFKSVKVLPGCQVDQVWKILKFKKCESFARQDQVGQISKFKKCEIFAT